jgi:DNA-binding transcriptional LysR family regulator
VALEQLAGVNMVNFDNDLPIRRHIDRVLEQHGCEVNVAMEFDNIEAIKRAIEIDAGVGLLPKPTLTRELESGTLAAVPLATDDLVRPLGIVHLRGKELSNTARRFIDLLQSDSQQPESLPWPQATNGHAEPGEPRPMESAEAARPADEGRSAAARFATAPLAAAKS